MKKVFIPRGQTATYTCLYTDRIIVMGTLRVSGKLVAKEILGDGTVEAREIICDDMRVSYASADFVTARNVAANKLSVAFECRASNQVAVRDYLNAGYVSTGKLSVSQSEVCTCDADEIITVRQRGSLLALLWATWWRSLFLDLFHGSKAQKPVKSKEKAPALQSEKAKSAPESSEHSVFGSDKAPDGDAIDLLITVLTELKDKGYRVSKVEPIVSATQEKADAA